MSKQVNKMKSLVFGDTPIFDAGNEDGWIRYKDIFIQVLKDDNGDYELAWQRNVPDHLRIDEMSIAVKFDKELDF